MLDERAPSDFQHWFGKALCQRTKPRTPTTNQDYCLINSQKSFPFIWNYQLVLKIVLFSACGRNAVRSLIERGNLGRDFGGYEGGMRIAQHTFRDVDQEKFTKCIITWWTLLRVSQELASGFAT